MAFDRSLTWRVAQNKPIFHYVITIIVYSEIMFMNQKPSWLPGFSIWVAKWGLLCAGHRMQRSRLQAPASPIQSTCAPPSTYASPAYQRSPQSRLLQASQLKLVYAVSPNLPPLLLLCGYFWSDIFTHSLCDSSFRCDNLYNRNRNSLCFGGFSVIQVTYEVYLINRVNEKLIFT